MRSARHGAPHAANLLQVYDRALDTDPLWQQATRHPAGDRARPRTQALLGLLPLDVSANKDFSGIGSRPDHRPRRIRR